MKRLFTKLIAGALLTFVSITALGDSHKVKEHFTFNQDVLIGSTMVKEGKYLVEYDTATREMQIKDNDGDVVARATASLTVHESKFRQDAILTMSTAEGIRLTGLRLGGENEELTLTDAVVITDGELFFVVDMIGLD